MFGFKPIQRFHQEVFNAPLTKAQETDSLTATKQAEPSSQEKKLANRALRRRHQQYQSSRLSSNCAFTEFQPVTLQGHGKMAKIRPRTPTQKRILKGKKRPSQKDFYQRSTQENRQHGLNQTRQQRKSAQRIAEGIN